MRPLLAALLLASPAACASPSAPGELAEASATQDRREVRQERRRDRRAARGRAADEDAPTGLGGGAPVRLSSSAWPVFHGNLSATASSPERGPGAVTTAQRVDGLTSRRRRAPAVSPWTVIGERYADGSEPIFTTPMDGVGKYRLRGGNLEAVSFVKLDRGPIDFDWGLVLLEGNLAVVTEQKRDRFVVVGDAREGDAASPLEVKAVIPVSRDRYGQLTAHHSLAPGGHLIALTDEAQLLAVDLRRGEVAASLDLSEAAGYAYHNSFPIDDGGRIYLAGQQQVAAIDWNGEAFSVAWTARYDMRGPGCEDVREDRPFRKEAAAVARGARCTGGGTTPTLLGDRSDVLVLTDGHAPSNNLVAFWRDAPPTNWTALPDPTGRAEALDRRVAGVFALPHSTPDGDGHTAENSPAALGDGVLIAQWAGLRPGPRSARGVQRVDWNPEARRFELVWARADIQFNGVPLVACAAEGQDCHAYGMGRYGPGYAYVSLDWATGEETGRVDLGTDDEVLDQGNGNAVASDGSIIYPGKHVLVRVE